MKKNKWIKTQPAENLVNNRIMTNKSNQPKLVFKTCAQSIRYAILQHISGICFMLESLILTFLWLRLELTMKCLFNRVRWDTKYCNYGTYFTVSNIPDITSILRKSFSVLKFEYCFQYFVFLWNCFINNQDMLCSLYH